jgi:hypothetical protein
VAADFFSACGKHAPWCVGDGALDGISRLIKGNKENKTVFRFAGTKQRLPFLCFLWFEEVLTFPRNPALVSVLYVSERPEMTSEDEEPKKAKTTKS